MGTELSFNRWVELVFDRPVTDPEWYWKEDHEWSDLSASTAVAYMTQLFTGSRAILSAYSDEQVNQGLWFLIGPASDTVRRVVDFAVPEADRLRCLSAIPCLFDYLQNRCAESLSHLDEPGMKPLNSICYMFWDLFPNEGRFDPRLTERCPREVIFTPFDRTVLATLGQLLQIPTDACRESALHGLNHWQRQYPQEVAYIVDCFLEEHRVQRPELRNYAEAARNGGVL